MKRMVSPLSVSIPSICTSSRSWTECKRGMCCTVAVPCYTFSGLSFSTNEEWCMPNGPFLPLIKRKNDELILISKHQQWGMRCFLVDWLRLPHEQEGVHYPLLMSLVDDFFNT